MTIELYLDLDDVFWFRNDVKHNNYGPAVEFNDGYKSWYVNGLLHRLGGPAVEYYGGNKAWYINDVEYTYLEYLVAVEQYNTNKENI